MLYRILASACVVVALTGSAAADNKQEARDLAAKSAVAYKQGKFEEAATLLRDAYARYPEPNLLYNLARALEGLGDRQGAIDAYERYLDSKAQIEDRPGIERRVTTLKAELEEQRKAEAAKAEAAKAAAAQAEADKTI